MWTTERLNQDWLLATEIHKLEARLWRRTKDAGCKVILLTSPARGEGKTTTAAYLATAMALHPDRRVLVVDLDFRESTLNTHLGLECTCGLGAVIGGGRPIEEAIIQTELPNLHVILPSPEGENPKLLLRTRPLLELFDALRNQYDIIFLDVPALLPAADASLLFDLADGVVMIAMAGRTTKPELTRAREICEGMGAKILGLIVGNLNEVHPEYTGEQSYYGYYQGPRRGDGNAEPRAAE